MESCSGEISFLRADRFCVIGPNVELLNNGLLSTRRSEADDGGRGWGCQVISTNLLLCGLRSFVFKTFYIFNYGINKQNIK